MSEKGSIANRIHYLLTTLCAGALLVLGLLMIRGKIEIRQIDRFSGAAIEVDREGEEYFELATEGGARCFKYEGTLIDCWIDVEQDGVESQILDTRSWRSLVKDELSAVEKPSGRLFWAWHESGDEVLWTLGITVTDLNDTTRGGGVKMTEITRYRHTGGSMGSTRWSLEGGDEIPLYTLKKIGEGENGKREWTATLKCKAVK